jgi:hypothetical protein
VLHFTGHSLGGLLASTMALWLADYLSENGRDDLLTKLTLDVFSYAAPTAGNRAFAAYCGSRIPDRRRYACGLDIVPCAWEEAALELLPSLYKPDIEMQGITRSLYDFCLGLTRGREYSQPGAPMKVPSRVAPIQNGLFLLEAIYQHAMPYLDMLPPERRETILREVIEPIYRHVPVNGILPTDLERLFTTDRTEDHPRAGPAGGDPGRRPGGAVPGGPTGP